MREQVCTYMCPWPRIQAAMLDEYALIVTYTTGAASRAASRQEGALRDAGKPAATASTATPASHVCPTGIDIRDGQQLNASLRAVHRRLRQCHGQDRPAARGLIAYDTDYSTSQRRGSGRQPSEHALAIVAHPRTRALRRRIIALVGVDHAAMRCDPRPARDQRAARPQPAVVTLSDGSIRNGYTVKLLNMIPEPRTFSSRSRASARRMTIIGVDRRRNAGRWSRSGRTRPAKLRVLRDAAARRRREPERGRRSSDRRRDDRRRHRRHATTSVVPETNAAMTDAYRGDEFTGRHMLGRHARCSSA